MPFLLIGIHATNLIFDHLSFRDLVMLQRVCRYTDAALNRNRLKKRCVEEPIPLLDVDVLWQVYGCSRRAGEYIHPKPCWTSRLLRRRYRNCRERTKLQTLDDYFSVDAKVRREWHRVGPLHWYAEMDSCDRWDCVNTDLSFTLSNKQAVKRGLYGLRLGKKEDARRQAVLDQLLQEA